MRRTRLASWLLHSMLWAPGGVGQTPDAAAKPQAITAPDPNQTPEPDKFLDQLIDADDLDGLLLPLTKDELVVEADAWLRALQAKVKEIKTAERTARHSESDEAKSAELERALVLRRHRKALIDRTKAVVAALAAKGGEVETYEKYVSTVEDLPKVDPSDLAAVWTVVIGWLRSEEGGLRWGANLALFLLTLLIFKFLGAILARITERALGTLKKTSRLLRDFLVNTVRKLTFFIGIVVALSMLEVNIGPFVAAIGAAGFVIGFALQGTLSNFASGIMILLYRPYDIGDFVTVAGTSGVVSDMTLVSTAVRTADNQVVIIPNSSIWGDVITNTTGSETRRVDLTFGIGYGDDLAKAQAVLTDIVSRHPLVLKDPEPLIKLHALADSSVNFIVRPWVKTGDYWTVYWDVTRSVKERFDAEGISIPFPQRDVHLYRESAS